jgi:hypothetical protein
MVSNQTHQPPLDMTLTELKSVMTEQLTLQDPSCQAIPCHKSWDYQKKADIEDRNI